MFGIFRLLGMYLFAIQLQLFAVFSVLFSLEI